MANGQNIAFTFVDGSSIQFWLNSIETIHYDDDLIIVEFIDDSEFTSNVSMIQNYELVSLLSGIDQQEVRNNPFSIYPNPAEETVHFNIDLEQGSTATLAIHNMEGRMVASYSNISEFPFTWNGASIAGRLQAGTYVCTVTTNRGVYTKKLRLK